MGIALCCNKILQANVRSPTRPLFAVGLGLVRTEAAFFSPNSTQRSMEKSHVGVSCKLWCQNRLWTLECYEPDVMVALCQGALPIIEWRSRRAGGVSAEQKLEHRIAAATTEGYTALPAIA